MVGDASPSPSLSPSPSPNPNLSPNPNPNPDLNPSPSPGPSPSPSPEQVPTAVFSHPPLAVMGLTEAEAIARYGEAEARTHAALPT